jgi:hypothetical protein
MSHPYIVEIEGVPVQCETPAAVRALIREHGDKVKSVTRRITPQPAHAVAATAGPQVKVGPEKEWVAFLEGVKAEKGMPKADAVTAMGAKNIPGLGGKFKVLNSRLKGFGIDKGEAFVSTDDAFRAGVKIDAALAALRNGKHGKN